MGRRTPPKPPRPELLRQPTGPFGWMDAALLHDAWLAELGPHATAILVLLAIAADRHGASFYGRDRMASALALTRAEVDAALSRLLDAELVAHRPWRPGDLNGVWQLLPVPSRTEHPRAHRTLHAADILRRLGFESAGRLTAE